MSDNDQDRVAEQLLTALKRKLFTDPVDRTLAKECVTRLNSKVRVTVLGPRPADATDLVNFLVGKDLIPSDAANCLTTLQKGQISGAKAVDMDGTERFFTEQDLAEAFAGTPRQVTIHADLPALGKITVNKAAARSNEGLRKAASVASAWTDVGLWISTEFTDEELAAWQELPDRIRDHGYLVVAPGTENLVTIKARAEGNFAGVIEIDPLAASSARSAPGGVDKPTFKAMGGTVMVQTIKREIGLINKATLDTGEVLLMRLPTQANSAGAAKSPATAKPTAPETPKSFDKFPSEPDGPRTSDAPKSRSVADRIANGERRTPAASNPASHDAETGPVPDTSDDAEFHSEVRRSRPRSVVRTRSRPTQRPATPWSMDL